MNATGGGGGTLVEVWSEPAGAVVVVNGLPVGPAPQKVPVTLSRAGFLREPVRIGVRFAAGAGAPLSATQETVLTLLDRAPARLEFTRDDVRRVMDDR